jgi:hypothetical protein
MRPWAQSLAQKEKNSYYNYTIKTQMTLLEKEQRTLINISSKKFFKWLVSTGKTFHIISHEGNASENHND